MTPPEQMSQLDLYDLTQSKLETSLKTRRNSNIDLRRLVLLTNAAFTSWPRQDSDEHVSEEELQRWKEQEWFDQLMGDFSEDEDNLQDDHDVTFLQPDEQHMLLSEESWDTGESFVAEDLEAYAPWSIPLPLSPRQQPDLADLDSVPPLERDLPELSYSPTESPPSTPPFIDAPHPPVLLMPQTSGHHAVITNSDSTSSDDSSTWDVQDYGLPSLFAQYHPDASGYSLVKRPSPRRTWSPPPSLSSAKPHQSRMIDGLLLS